MLADWFASSQVILEDPVQSRPDGLELMYLRLLEFVPHHCRLLREVTGGAVSRYRCTRLNRCFTSAFVL